MNRMMIVAVALFALLSVAPERARAQCVGCGYASATGSVTTATTCCYAVVSDDSYAARVARWGVGLQLRGWLGKRPEDMTRDDVRSAQTRLDALCAWAKKDVANRVFASAYLQWAAETQSMLTSASTRIDHDEIASALLLHGLPALPEAAR